jgi:hypothetical protein
MNKQIIMSQVVINKDQIIIESISGATTFCRVRKNSYPDIKDLENEVKKLRKYFRNNHVTLHKTDTLTLLKRKTEYNNFVAEYNHTYDQLMAAWTEKMKTGIFYGCSDDKDLNNIIHPLQSKLDKFNYRNCLLSQICDIQHSINDIKKDLKFEPDMKFVSVSI